MQTATIDIAAVQSSVAWLKAQAVEGPPIAPHAGLRAPYALSAGISLDAIPQPTFTDNTKDVYTDVGGCVVFADAFDADLMQNLVFSWEYGARWANKQIHTKYGLTDPANQNCDTIFSHAMEWYAYFTQCMHNLHWIIKDFDWTTSAIAGDTFTVDQQILAVLEAFLAADAISLAAVKSAIGVLKGLGAGDSRMVLWDSHSNSAGKGTFQMGSIRDGGGGLATVRTAALELDSSETTTTCFFFFHYATSRTKVSQASQDLVFNNAAYIMQDASGQSAKSLVEAAVVTTSNQFLANDGGIE